jgi:hypothetical protein
MRSAQNGISAFANSWSRLHQIGCSEKGGGWRLECFFGKRNQVNEVRKSEIEKFKIKFNVTYRK